MSQSSKPIAQCDWNRQRDNFIDLYHRRKLPLQSTNGEPSVIQIMSDEYNFSASLSQFEAQIRRWGIPKNLKRSEWVQIIAKIDNLNSRGVETRLKVAGNLVSDDKIKQKRRVYLKGVQPPPNDTDSRPDSLLWNSARFTLETLSTAGQWLPYHEERLVGHNFGRPAAPEHGSAALGPPSRPLQLDTGNGFIANLLGHGNKTSILSSQSSSTTHDHLGVSVVPDPFGGDTTNIQANEYINDTELHRPVPINASNHMPDACTSGIADVMEINRDNEHSAIVLDSRQDTSVNVSARSDSPYWSDWVSFSFARDTSPQLSHIFDSSPSPIPVSANANSDALIPEVWPLFQFKERGRTNGTASPGTIAPGETLHRKSSMSVFQELTAVMDTAQMITACLGQTQSTQNHEFRRFASSLDSLLPDNTYALSEPTNIFDPSSIRTSRILGSPFLRAILFSIINGFAGLPRLPPLPLLQFSLSLLKDAKFRSPFAARALVDNAFTVAVESGNARAVDTILKMTSGTTNAIDVNKVINPGHGVRRPIEIALGGQEPDLETAEVLVKNGADLDRALQLVVGTNQREIRRHSAGFGFVRLLLKRGALPSASNIHQALQHDDATVAELLCSSVPRASYCMFFDARCLPQSSTLRMLPLLALTALYLENGAAARIVKRVLREWPEAQIEKTFPNTHEKTMNYTLVHACLNGNMELAKFLLPFVSQISSAALVAAIKSRQQQLIELLLESGANTSDIAEYDPAYLGATMKSNLTIQNWLVAVRVSTPLVAAIQSKNETLIQRWKHKISRTDSDCLTKALEAAVAADYMDLFQEILPRLPRRGMGYLQKALCLSIAKKHNEMTFMLLDAGAELKPTNGGNQDCPDPLLFAIRTRQKNIFQAILQHGADLSDSSYIRAATLWGDVDVVKDLLSSQAILDVEALMTALRVGNKEITDILLDYFWRHEAYLHHTQSRKPDGFDNNDFDKTNLVEWAICTGDETFLVHLLKRGARVDRSALTTASNSKQYSILECLLAYATRPDEAFEAVVYLKNPERLRQWLSSGATVFRERLFLHAVRFDKPSFNILMEAFVARYPQGLKGWGTSLLIYAIRKGDSSLLMELLTARMDVNSFGRVDVKRRHWNGQFTKYQVFRYTPLGFMICQRKGINLDHVRMLLEAGSEPNSIAKAAGHQSAGWKTPLLLAVDTGNLQLVQLLLRWGADVNLAACNGRKRTPLQQACGICNFPMVELLLSRQANVAGEPAMRGGVSALQAAAIAGSTRIASFLLINGADVRAPKAKVDGRTPFEGAAEYGRLDMLKLIWDASVPEELREEEVRNAIYYSRKNGHHACEQYIRTLVPSAENDEISDSREKEQSWHLVTFRLYSSRLKNMISADESDEDFWESDEETQESKKESQKSHDRYPRRLANYVRDADLDMLSNGAAEESDWDD